MALIWKGLHVHLLIVCVVLSNPSSLSINSDNNLHRQMRATIQQVLGESMGKRDADMSPIGGATSGASGVAMQGSPSAATRAGG
jgi:hypothetical protein